MKNNINNLKHKGVTWLNIISPKEEDLAYLEKNYKFHELDLEDCLPSKLQRAKIDEYEKYLFIVIHIPTYNSKNKQNKIISEEINIFIGQDYLITLHSGNIKILNKLFEDSNKHLKIRSELMGEGSGYLLYEIISNLFDACFPILNDLEDELGTVEKDVFISNLEQKDKLKDILLLKKELITFRRIILPQRTVIAQLEHKNKKFLPSDLEVYFDDVVDKIEKIWNTLENLSELVQSLQDTNESVISHNTNRVMKTLTIFSAIMLPLTFITGLYGMNLQYLPLTQQKEAFYHLLGGMATVVTTMLIFFKLRKWL